MSISDIDDGYQNVTVSLVGTTNVLFGRTTVPLYEGVADFLDLGVLNRGVGVQLLFVSSYDAFTMTTSFDVLFSSEFQVGACD